MPKTDATPSPIKACEAALAKLGSNPDDPAAFQEMAALVAPGLFKGQGKFFDHVCEHAARADGGSSLPALNAFMDRLTRAGDIPSEDGSPPLAWRSAAILCELHPEDGSDDPLFLTGLEQLCASLAEAAGAAPAMASLSPLALDLRTAAPGFDLFRFCMLPTQAQAIGHDALRREHPCGRLPAGWPEPPRLWKALCVSFAYPHGQAPDGLAARLGAAIGAGTQFPCGYESDGVAKSAVLALKMACDPFSCASMGLEPERREIAADLETLARALGPELASFDAILEPSSQPGPEAGAEEPFDSFCLSLCSPDGALVDAIWLPPAPESVALAHALLRERGLTPIFAPPRRAQFNAGGERLWASPGGAKPFDPEVWRDRILRKAPKAH